MKKNVLLILLMLVIAAGLLLYGYYRTQTRWVESPDYHRDSAKPAKTLVVAYSRTGNTLAAAKTAAEYFNADLVTVSAPEYSNTLDGLRRASDDASAEKVSADIRYQPVNMTDYEFIILTTPTWWFRPAVPMYAFVAEQDFGGKPVLLIMTGNSRMREDKTASFITLLEQQQGQYIDTLFIRRGRIYWQKSAEEVSHDLLSYLKANQRLWQ